MKVSEPEARLRLCVAASNIGLWDWDLVSNEVYFSPEWKGQLGYANDELSSRFEEWQGRLHPDDLAPTLAAVQNFIDDPAAQYAVEFRLRHKDGSYRWIFTQAQISRDAAGKPVRMMGCHIDITERKRAETERDRFFNLSLDPLCVAGFDGFFKQLNPAWSAMLGWTVEELKSKPLLDFVHPDDREATLQSRARVQRGELGLNLENRYRHRDGSYRWLSWKVFPLVAEQMIFGVVRDVTEHKRAEEEVRASHQMLQLILNNIPQGVFWKDRESRYLGCNDVVVRGLGIEGPESLAGKTDADLRSATSEQAEFFMRRDREVMESGKAQLGLIEQAAFADGSTRWLETNKMPMLDTTGKVIGLLGTWQDITARKQAEDYAAVENTLREILLHSSGDEMFADVLDFVRARFDSRFGFFGYIRDTDGALVCPSMTRDIWERCNVETKSIEFPRAAWGGLWGRVLLERRPLIKNDPHKTPQGHVPLFRSMGAPVVAEGELIGSIHLANRETDYTQADLNSLSQICSILAPTLSLWLQRRKAEQQREEALQELRESEARLRSILDSMFAFVALISTDGILLDTNRAPLEAAGLKREDVVGRPFADAYWCTHSPQAQEQIRNVLRRAATGETVREDFPVRVAGNRIIALDATFGPLLDAQGQVMQIVGSGVDITARKQAEAEREKLEVQLRQTQKMEAIGTLAGGIAHDFNNILGAILGNVAMAQEDAGPGHPVQESLEQIFKASERARNLVHKILAFSRQLPREERVQNLRSIMEEDVRLLRATLPAGVELIARFAEDAPSVLADRTEFHQVLLNLCTNSWHAMEGRSGQITLRLEGVTVDDALARHHADLRPGRYARLTVADTGKGMDAATLERIFDPFFTTKEVDQGTGLGLSVVHGIMKHHQGAITVASQPGRGTTFELYFPAAAREDRAAPPVPVKPVGLPQGRGQHVLCLDDEASLVSLIARTLRRQGYHVTSFTNAEAALAALRVDPSGFDLVVTDHNMPGTSGIEVALEIRKLRPELPVILTSGFITEKIRAEAEAAGIRQLLHKPYRVEEFCQTVQYVLQSAQ